MLHCLQLRIFVMLVVDVQCHTSVVTAFGISKAISRCTLECCHASVVTLLHISGAGYECTL